MNKEGKIKKIIYGSFVFALAFIALSFIVTDNHSLVVSASDSANSDLVFTKLTKDIVDSPSKLEQVALKVENKKGEVASGKDISFTLISSSLELLQGPKVITTDENGVVVYEVQGLNRGKYYIIAEANGQKATFALDIKAFSLLPFYFLWPYILAALIIAATGCLISIKMKSGNVVVDEKTGKGVQGVFVEIYDDIGKIVVNTMTSTNGGFLGKLDKGEYLLRVSKDGYSFRGVVGHHECSDIQSNVRLLLTKREHLKILISRS